MKKISLILAISLATVLVACGKQESTTESAAPAAPETTASAPAAVENHDETANKPEEAANDMGKKVFGTTCALCHASGAAGAPRFGDKADWDPRIAQGMDVLYKHALEGFTGAKGMMPARGGSATLSDEQVKAAVNYMVDKVK